MSYNPPPVADEQEALVAFLTMQHDAFRALTHGLSDHDAGRAPSASSLSIGGLIQHVTVVQRDWLKMAKAAPVPAPSDADNDQGELMAAFDFESGGSIVTALQTFDEVAGEVIGAVRTLDLDTPVPVPDAPWFPKDVEAWSVRWVWFHLLGELTRHAGHGDIIRETIDGATMYELVAANEDLPEFPPYLTQWRPSEPPFATGVSTVTTVVADPAQARAWYTEVLGADPYFDQGPYVEWRVGPHDREIGLLDAAVTPPHVPAGTSITYWEVTDTHACYARLIELGASEHWPPMAYGGGYIGASVLTPFGNIVGVMQRSTPGEVIA